MDSLSSPWTIGGGLILIVALIALLRYGKSFSFKGQVPGAKFEIEGANYKPERPAERELARNPEGQKPQDGVPDNQIRLVLEQRQCYWSRGTEGEKPALQVTVRGLATSTYPRANVLVPACKIPELRVTGEVNVYSQDLGFWGAYPLPPHRGKRISMHFWIIPPPALADGEDFTFDAVLVDQYGVEHEVRQIVCRFAG